MKIAKGINIDAVEYASQGNAILGIRDSGKTYSATYLAEQLMENNIPFIAFDPIGVWRYLKMGKSGKGYPVVVAGENADLPLSTETAPEIVRAAMQAGASLVIDLYSIQLSKADWKKIVESCIRLLLYENKDHGLRHIFIEEAAEFVPQVVRPDEGKVYAEIEKLARMGGNASLGFTLINQRAEQINKAVLELCDCLFLHRQKGRHSITALGKWLDAADAGNSKEITNSLPSLEQGECWIWSQGSHDPKRIKMPEKKTIHPDRRNPNNTSKGVMADVSVFVHNMQAYFERNSKKLPVEKEKSPKKTQQSNDDDMAAEYLEKISELENQLAEEKKKRQNAEMRLNAVKILLQPQYDQLKKVFEAVPISENGATDDSIDYGKYKIWLEKLTGKHRTMLELLVEHKRLDRAKWCFLVGIPYKSGFFDQGVTKIRKIGLVQKEGNEFVLKSMQ